MQREVYEKLDEESHRWLQCNVEPRKVVSIIAVQEQMVETRAWKANRGLQKVINAEYVEKRRKQ